jgi:hypothetical protein
MTNYVSLTCVPYSSFQPLALDLDVEQYRCHTFEQSSIRKGTIATNYPLSFWSEWKSQCVGIVLLIGGLSIPLYTERHSHDLQLHGLAVHILQSIKVEGFIVLDQSPSWNDSKTKSRREWEAFHVGF